MHGLKLSVLLSPVWALFLPIWASAQGVAEVDSKPVGHFRCKAGELVLVDSVAAISIVPEHSPEYRICVHFYYAQMSSNQITMAKRNRGVLPFEEATKLKLPGFPGRRCPSLCFWLGQRLAGTNSAALNRADCDPDVIGSWSIGQDPPLTATGLKHVTFATDRSRQAWDAEMLPSIGERIETWSMRPDGDQYIVQGHFVGSAHVRWDKDDPEDMWQWDVAFTTRTVNAQGIGTDSDHLSRFKH